MSNHMMENRYIGELQHFSFDGDKPMKGWYLMVFPTGEEYLLMRHPGYPFGSWQTVYQVSTSLGAYSLASTHLNFDKYWPTRWSKSPNWRLEQARFRGIIALWIMIAVMIRQLTKQFGWLVFGVVNLPFNWWQAAVNLGLFAGIIWLYFFAITLWRKQGLLSQLKKLDRDVEVDLEAVGRLRALKHFTILPENAHWTKFKRVMQYLFIAVLTLPFIVLTAVVPLRLFVIIPLLIWHSLFLGDRGHPQLKSDLVCELKLKDDWMNL